MMVLLLLVLVHRLFVMARIPEPVPWRDFVVCTSQLLEEDVTELEDTAPETRHGGCQDVEIVQSEIVSSDR